MGLRILGGQPLFLLISLAVADLLVGFVTILTLLNFTVSCRLFFLSLIGSLLDMFAGLSSIFHLAVISLERLHATLRPFCHRQLSLKAYWVAIATPWLLSLSLSIFRFVFYKMSLRYYFQVNYIIITFSLATSLLTTFPTF